MEDILKHYPIDVPIATCYKMRSDDEEWTRLTGSVSGPFKRGAKDLRVFYPDDKTEAPFFVSDTEYTVRRGILWATGDSYKSPIAYTAAKEFLKKAEDDLLEAKTRIGTLKNQITFLKTVMVWCGD